MKKISIYKDKHIYMKKHPYVVVYGDIRASFKTKKEAQRFAEKKMKHYSINPVTFMVESDAWREP